MPDAARPFAQTPSPGRHAAVPSAEAVRGELAEAALAGDGLTLLTGEPGRGKTHLAGLLCEDVGDRLTAVPLSDGRLPTRRALYQTVLSHLGRSFVGRTESECRLELLSAAGDAAREGRPLLLVVDDAHECNNRILEEFRSLQNFVRGGEPLFRTTLVGLPCLEERLAAGGLDAVNQRVSCLAEVARLSERESAQYVGLRMEAAGLSADASFTAEAIVEICRAADGSPRALNHLAERTLKIAEGPATSDTVLEALRQLASLPVAWNLPPEESPDLDGLFEDLSFETPANDVPLEPLDGAVLEIGGDAVATDGSPDSRDELRRMESVFAWPEEDADFAAVSQDQLESAFDPEPEGLGEDDPAEAEPSALGEWDDVLPDLPVEAGEGEFAVESGPPLRPWSPPEVPPVDDPIHAAETLLEAVIPLVDADAGEAEIEAVESALADRGVPEPEPALSLVTSGSAEIAPSAVTSAGPQWPVERPAVIEPPHPDDPVRDLPQPAAEGLFTRLRRRRNGG